MDVYVSFDGDGVGQQVGRRSLANDVEGLRRIAQAIDHGEELWRSWCLSTGGSVISLGGDEGRIQVPADHLHDLDRVRKQYAGQVGFSVSVGVGMELSHADKALLAAKMRGKDQVVFWTPQVDQEVQKAFEEQRSEAGKLYEEYAKAEHKVAMNPGGFQGPHRERTAGPQRPAGGQGEHSSAKDVHDLVEQSQPPQPEMTHAADDFEEAFHQEASKQASVDDAEDAKRNSDVEQVKAQVVQVLQQVRQLAPVLEQVQQTAPDVYNAVGTMTQAMISLARELAEQQQAQQRTAQPAEREESPAQEMSKADHQRPLDGLDSRRVGRDAVHLDPEFDPSKEQVDGALGKKGRQWCTACKDPLDADGHCKVKAHWAALDKAAMIPTPRHHQVLPVGSQIDASPQGTRDVGKVKVAHGDGRQGWIHARAGQIMSTDGHPISSRNPKGR